MKPLLKVGAILWIIWGLVHILAGVMTMKGVLTADISGAIQGIADGAEPSGLEMNYPVALGAILGQPKTD